MEMALETEWPTPLMHRALGVNAKALGWVLLETCVWVIRWWAVFSPHRKLILTTLWLCALTETAVCVL